jgi:transposase
MLGKTEKQVSFSDYWLEGRIPENSYWYKMRKWAEENLNEEIFQPLFSYYGRPSISPVYTFMGLLIQLEKGYSDKEFEEESTFDDRIKYAITAPRDFEGIDAVTLHDHRARFFKSDIGRKIFLQVLEQARDAGMFSKENIHVIDSFMVWGKSARQDTYTMIYQAIKMVLRLAKFREIPVEGLVVLEQKDYYKAQKKPDVNWDDDNDKRRQLDRLVRDALGLVRYIREQAKDGDTDLLSACNLLEKVATQDVEKDENGIYRMVMGTAKDRIISINDPEMRHGHKTSSKIQDGYKAEIITGGEKGELVLGVKVDAANTIDGEHMGELIDEIKEGGHDIDKLYGDSAYCDYEEIEKREKEGMEFCIKVRNAVNRNGLFTKDDFIIDLEEGVITCPAGKTAVFNKKKIRKGKKTTVGFSKEVCLNCPMRDKCTSSKNGRKITIHSYEEKIQEQRKYQKTPEYKKDYSKRANGERTISHITRHGGRKGRYIGKEKTGFQILIACINNNIKAVMGYIIKKARTLDMGEVCSNIG